MELPEKLTASGHDVRLELCLNACAPCERGLIVARVDGQMVAQSLEDWLAGVG